MIPNDAGARFALAPREGVEMDQQISSPPWEYVGPYVRDADSLEVCRLPLWRETRAVEGPILAAAPDLKDALIQLQAAVDDLCRKLPRDPEFCADYTPQWDALEAAGLAAEAAIAKAKGGS